MVNRNRGAQKLLKAGRKIGPKLREMMSIVKYESFLRWVREQDVVCETRLGGLLKSYWRRAA